MYVISFDLERNVSFNNVLKFRDILLISKESLHFYHEHCSDDEYTEICKRVLQGVFKSFGENYDDYMNNVSDFKTSVP